MFKTKIVIIGPCDSGKTVITNFLSDATESTSGEYHPTQGVRIMEFEMQNMNVGERLLTAEIELWDCGGSHKFESCWPAMMRDCHGCILVFNPDKPSHSKELEIYYSNFIKKQGLKDSQCLLLVHHKPNSSPYMSIQLPHQLSRIHTIHSSLEEEGNALKAEFVAYLGRLFSTLAERRDQEELNIMNNM